MPNSLLLLFLPLLLLPLLPPPAHNMCYAADMAPHTGPIQPPTLDNLNQLSANQRHIHLIEIKCNVDTRPWQQLEAAQQQHVRTLMEKLSRCMPSFWESVGPVILSIPLTSLNNWYLTTNVPLNSLTNFMPILLRMPTS
eukprot:1154404-Pelagomonas_calceolata.AAC.1